MEMIANYLSIYTPQQDVTDTIDILYNDYLIKFGKSYASVDEYQLRKQNF